jgi:O-antigen biosynthesis protein
LEKKFDISIIIVNYNVKDFLYQCLKSIEKAKRNLSVEVIVVDNASRDASVEYLQPFFPDVRFIALEENLGFGRANNLGFKSANGKYYLILNPDTIVQENTLEVMYEYMQANPNVGVSGCKVLNPDGSFQLACRRGFPTPWNAFSKLFGLQMLFPKSKLFAGYNQTFKDINETYEIDALIGAFMFARADVIDELDGFDEAYFMYGEDIDLCKRIKQSGFDVHYVHTTSIIHYKGESTKRSDINDIRHFYEAMEIYAKKYFSSSGLFLFFLRIGIFIRSLIAYFFRYSRDIIIITSDLLAINVLLMVASFVRFDKLLPFPDYAYPIVFIAVTIVFFFSMFFVGEYLERESNIGKSIFGVLISFFILSSLTYFFKEYAFSRGIVLLLTGLMVLYITISRLLLYTFEILKGKNTERRIVFVGINQHTLDLLKNLTPSTNLNLSIIGMVSTDTSAQNELLSHIPILGNIDSLKFIINKNKINEVIITDKSISKRKLIDTMANVSSKSVRFHIADEYEELITSRILNELLEEDIHLPKYKYLIARYYFIKRSVDIILSILLLVFLFPGILFANKIKNRYINIWKVLINEMSFIGLTPNSKWKHLGKPGIINFSNVLDINSLSNDAVERLNEHYLANYSFSLDIDILLKYIVRGNNGKSNNT